MPSADIYLRANPAAGDILIGPSEFLDTSNEHAEIWNQWDQFDVQEPQLAPNVHFIYARDLHQGQLVICHNYVLTTEGTRAWSRRRLQQRIRGEKWYWRGGPIGLTAVANGPRRLTLFWDKLPSGEPPVVDYQRSVSMAQCVIRATQVNPDWSYFTEVAHLDGNRQHNYKENLAYCTRLYNRQHRADAKW